MHKFPEPGGKEYAYKASLSFLCSSFPNGECVVGVGVLFLWSQVPSHLCSGLCLWLGLLPGHLSPPCSQLLSTRGPKTPFRWADSVSMDSVMYSCHLQLFRQAVASLLWKPSTFSEWGWNFAHHPFWVLRFWVCSGQVFLLKVSQLLRPVGGR